MGSDKERMGPSGHRGGMEKAETFGTSSDPGAGSGEAGQKAVVLGILQQLAVALQRLFSPFCEVVIHDFADIEHSIVFVAGNITNRSIGGPPTDLLLARIRGGRSDEDLHNYMTSLSGGRVMKSSTVFLRDASGEAYGAFCVNFDVTPFLSFSEPLASLVSVSDRTDVTELLSGDFEETLQSLVSETIYEMRRGTSIMGRDDKIALFAALDAKGVFRVKKAVNIVADLLGLSRATVYNYLRDARNAETA